MVEGEAARRRQEEADSCSYCSWRLIHAPIVADLCSYCSSWFLPASRLPGFLALFLSPSSADPHSFPAPQKAYATSLRPSGTITRVCVVVGLLLQFVKRLRCSCTTVVDLWVRAVTLMIKLALAGFQLTLHQGCPPWCGNAVCYLLVSASAAQRG